ncbi:hypothetical protein IF1G_00603 [Cordyceps javanica]|uniref:Uncharacterized protein n=1 Tax=Cordyceps javanica TaxID=43265 RepID=A0A545VG29_9HYPO|nr:hypothetical protein IF1G_00603 [Cordyceps javanica]
MASIQKRTSQRPTFFFPAHTDSSFTALHPRPTSRAQESHRSTFAADPGPAARHARPFCLYAGRPPCKRQTILTAPGLDSPSAKPGSRPSTRAETCQPNPCRSSAQDHDPLKTCIMSVVPGKGQASRQVARADERMRTCHGPSEPRAHGTSLPVIKAATYGWPLRKAGGKDPWLTTSTPPYWPTAPLPLHPPPFAPLFHRAFSQPSNLSFYYCLAGTVPTSDDRPCLHCFYLVADRYPTRISAYDVAFQPSSRLPILCFGRLLATTTLCTDNTTQPDTTTSSVPPSPPLGSRLPTLWHFVALFQGNGQRRRKPILHKLI